MKVITMFGLDNKENQEIGLRKGAEILSVCVVHEKIKIAVSNETHDHAYACQCSKYEFEFYEFVIVSSKQRFCIDEYKFLGTIVLNYGNDIYHVLYRKK